MIKLVTDRCPCCGTKGLNPKKIKDMCENCLETCFDQWRRKVTSLEEENEELKKQIDQLSTDNHVLKTAFIDRQGIIDNLKKEIADPKVAMETIKKYCIEISEKYGNCSKCVFCSKGYNGCKLQTSPDNWEM